MREQSNERKINQTRQIRGTPGQAPKSGLPNSNKVDEKREDNRTIKEPNRGHAMTHDP
jgi:hypothetical protein